MELRRRILRFIKQNKLNIATVLLTAVAEFILYNFIKGKLLSNTTLHNLDIELLSFFRRFLIVVFILIFLFNILSIIYKYIFIRDSLFQDIIHFNKGIIYLFWFFSNADKNKLKTAHFPKANWKRAKGILFGYTKSGKLICKPSKSEMNIAVYGTPGSSKTVSYVKPNARQFNGSVLAIDIKGDIYEYNKNSRPIIRFAPDIHDAIHRSAHFNPLSGVSKLNSAELKLFVSNMAEILIPDDSEKEKYFSTNARKLFCGMLLLLLETCPNLTFPEFLHAVLHYRRPTDWKLSKFPTTVFEWIECISASPYPNAAEQVTAMIGNNEKNISGVFDRLNTALVPFSNDVLDVLLDGKENCISAEALYSGYDIYLQISQGNLKTYAPLFTLIINEFMTNFAKRPDSAFANTNNRPILCILDEFPQLTFPYNTINQFLSTLRSKSIIIMLVCQTISQLAYKYDTYGYQALLGNCTYQVCCKSNDPTTLNYFKTIIGTKKTLKYSDLSIGETEEPVYKNEEYGTLNDDAIVYFDGSHIKVLKIKSYE